MDVVGSGLKWTQYGSRGGQGTILLVHGFMGSSMDWAELIPILIGRGLYCITVDLPYHGDSKAVAATSTQYVAELIVQFIRRERIQSVIVLGYSLGGRIAVRVCKLLQDQRECVLALVLVSAHPGIESSEARAKRRESDEILAKFLEQLAESSPARFKEWLDTSWYSKSLWGSLKNDYRYPEMLKRRLKDNNPTLLAAGLRAFTTGVDCPSSTFLAQCDFKVSYLYGSEDQKYSEIAKTLASRCKNIRVIEVDGAGHNVVLQQPRKVIDAVLDFISDETIASKAPT